MRQYINFLFRSRLVVVLLVLTGLFNLRTEAQTQGSTFGASVSPTVGTTSTSYTYTLGITNILPLGTLVNAYVTNVFSSDVLVTAISSNYTSTVTTMNSNVVFYIPQVVPGVPAWVALTVTSSNAVSLTNFISFSVGSPSNSFFTNLVVNVTNTLTLPTDLGVSVTGPGPDVYVGDWITFGVTVTNFGPNTASSIVLSNSFLSNGVQVVGIKPIVSPGLGAFSLTNGGSRTFQFTVQPTNAGTLPISVSISSDAADSNSTNNTAVTNITVLPFLTNTLTATITSTQRFNSIVGLMEQSVLLSNASPSSVPSARVKVSGIPAADRLYNAVGTNNGVPFVTHGAALGAGETVGLTLQYKVPSHQAFANPTLDARGMTNAADLTPPSNLLPLPLTQGATNYTRIDNYLGNMLLEIPTTNGRTYTVIYADNPAFTNPKVVRPSIVAPANWTYWIDYGPPATVSTWSNSPTRYYLIKLNP
ncbi:MAG TPA: DUF11 domain-containing protein [Candidatus Paceibacterota bacterium]|nr:DUF11 domain-containing protein [Candidatus Paceibacterota bacterium]